MEPTQRPTARVILADPDDRALLFRFVPPDPWPREPAATKERVFPPGLADLLAALLAGVRPATPVRLEWPPGA